MADQAPVADVPAAGGPDAGGNAAPADPWASLPADAKFPVKVNGEIRQLSRDEMRRTLSKELAADLKFRQAAERDAKFDNLVRNGDVDGIIKALGKDPKAYANQVLKHDIEDYIAAQEAKSLDPRERALREREARLARAEDEEKARKAQDQQRQQQAKVAEYQDYIGRTVSAALEATGLPKTPAVANRMLAKMEAFVENGVDFNPRDVAQEVEDDLYAEAEALLQSERAIKRISPATRSKFIEAHRSAAASPQPARVPVRTRPADKRQEESRPRRTSWQQAYNKIVGLDQSR